MTISAEALVEARKMGIMTVLTKTHKIGKMRILTETHTEGCTCSYCTGEHKIHYGLNIPPNWSGWNSWYIIKVFPRKYIRWTNRWFKIFKKKQIA